MTNILPILILVVTTVISTLLYLREYNRRKKIQSEGEKILDQFNEKGLNILQSSMKKSQAILGNAELEGVKVVADTKTYVSKLEDDYSAKFDSMIKQAGEAIKEASSKYLQFMSDQQNRTSEFESSGQKIIQSKINTIFEQLEQRLSDFLIQTEQKTTSSIELELKSARQLIETYKQQQLSLIDENIIAMMEQTLALVLNKKLSLKEQLDLVYEALEKAKAEKFIV